MSGVTNACGKGVHRYYQSRLTLVSRLFFDLAPIPPVLDGTRNVIRNLSCARLTDEASPCRRHGASRASRDARQPEDSFAVFACSHKGKSWLPARQSRLPGRCRVFGYANAWANHRIQSGYGRAATANCKNARGLFEDNGAAFS